MTYSSSLHNLGTNCPETGGELSRNWGRIVQRLGANRLGANCLWGELSDILLFQLFYTPSVKITKAIFEEYAGELTKNDLKVLISKLKEHKLSYLVFCIRFPFGIKLILNGKNYNVYAQCG